MAKRVKNPDVPKPRPKRPLPSVPEVRISDRAALRRWLTTHHATHGPIWLVYEKKRADGQRVLTYDDIVEEALCFGWIDSVAGRVDDRFAKLYFSPRKPKSVWSALNKRRIEKLTRLGLIMPAGQAKIDAAKRDGSWTALDQVEALIVPDDLAASLKKNAAAGRNFVAFPPGARKNILTWIASAKRPETRERRIKEVVQLAAKNMRARG